MAYRLRKRLSLVSGVDNSLCNLAVHNGVFVRTLSADSGSLTTTTDHITNTDYIVGLGGALGVEHNGTTFCVFRAGGTVKAITSATGLAPWTTTDLTGFTSIYDCRPRVFDDKFWVVAGEQTATSSNGVAWTYSAADPYTGSAVAVYGHTRTANGYFVLGRVASQFYVYKSANGTSGWSTTAGTPPESAEAVGDTAFLFYSVGTTLFYTAGHRYNGYAPTERYKSDDDGATWTALDDVSVYRQTRLLDGTMLCYVGDFYSQKRPAITADGLTFTYIGNTYQNDTSGNRTERFVEDRITGDLYHHSYFSGVYELTDDAITAPTPLTWSEGALPDDDEVTLTSNGTYVNAVTSGTSAGVRTADGSTWIASGSPATPIYDTVFHDGFIFGIKYGASNILNKSATGAAWANVGIATPCGGNIGSDGVALLIAHNSTSDPIVTLDEGATWTTYSSGITGYAYACNITDGNFLVMGNNSTGAISFDNGVTWDLVPELRRAFRGSRIGTTTVIVGDTDCFAVTDDDGATWANYSLPGVDSFLQGYTALAVLNSRFYYFYYQEEQIGGTGSFTGHDIWVYVSDDGKNWVREHTFGYDDTTVFEVWFAAYTAGFSVATSYGGEGGRTLVGEYVYVPPPPPDPIEYNETVSDTISTSEVLLDGYEMEALVAAMVMADEPLGLDLPNLIDRLNTTGSILVAARLLNTVGETVSFGETLNAAWTLLIQENMQLSGAIVGNPILLGALVDALHATGLAETRLDAVAALSGALAMESLIANGWTVSAVDSVVFNDALIAMAQFVTPLVDSIAVGGAATNSLRLLAVVADSVDLGADLTALAQLHAEASDAVMLYGTFRLGGIEYAGWALNTENQGASEYTNHPFDSLQVFQNRSFGAGDGGIYELTGDDDAGDPIAALVRTGLMDFATGKEKNIPDVFIGFAGDGRVVLKTTTTSYDGTKIEDWYISNPDNRSGAIREGRFQLGRGIESRYWGFELHNKAGGDLELSEIALRPVVLSRRR